MNTQEIQNQIEVLTRQVQELERISIQVQMDPNTALYLQPVVASSVNTALLTYPSQTYSTSLPSGTAPTGSVWFYDTGVLATRAVYVYSGVWIQFK